MPQSETEPRCHLCDRREMNAWFWWRNLKERGRLEDLDMEGRITLKFIVNNWDGMECIRPAQNSDN
jgi:hypothetical protein